MKHLIAIELKESHANAVSLEKGIVTESGLSVEVIELALAEAQAQAAERHVLELESQTDASPAHGEKIEAAKGRKRKADMSVVLKKRLLDRTGSEPSSPKNWTEQVAAAAVVERDSTQLSVRQASKEKPLSAFVYGKVFCIRDVAKSGGVPHVCMSIGSDGEVAEVHGWRQDAENLARLGSGAKGKTFRVGPVRYTTFRDEVQFEMLPGCQINVVDDAKLEESVAQTELALVPFKDIPQYKDYALVNVGGIVDGPCVDYEASQRSCRRTLFRLRDEDGYVLDIMGWGMDPGSRSWKAGSSLRIFFGKVNKERKCINLDVTRDGGQIEVRAASPSFSQEYSLPKMLEWPEYKRVKKA